jgi:hypothetical protein
MFFYSLNFRRPRSEGCLHHSDASYISDRFVQHVAVLLYPRSVGDLYDNALYGRLTLSSADRNCISSSSRFKRVFTSLLGAKAVENADWIKTVSEVSQMCHQTNGAPFRKFPVPFRPMLNERVGSLKQRSGGCFQITRSTVLFLIVRLLFNPIL